MKNTDGGNVVDFIERREEIRESRRAPESEAMKRIKLRIEMHDTKLMISTSLLSVLVFVTLANTSLLTSHIQHPGSSSAVMLQSGRDVASVQTGTSNWEDRIAQSLTTRTLKDDSQLGRRPSTLDQLTFGTLEGKYVVRMQNGKVHEINLADASASPKSITNLSSFLNDNKNLLLPANVASAELQKSSQDGGFKTESFRLIGDAKQDLGQVEFRLDNDGRMISMHVIGSDDVTVK